ncbi:glutamate synthase-related protein [Leucobacter denitrificans]|uniref:Glutamate synthase domain-containing protein n=1 Tax=Leucobacter denitrificans TaxID=683042 RepID=A0A7G9S4J2_9MICO|nr:glutamate synthase-related protein [Leucobacter denitrificans]QNN62767.1 hypothetical protein H9L06_11210 [Leucobacter denitrificans]
MTSKKRIARGSIGTAVGVVALGAVATYDLVQKKKAVLRNYPVIGHARYLLNKIRPQIQQYFIERDWDGRPFSRTTRDVIYARSKGEKGEEAFGTLTNVSREGGEWLMHSMVPLEPPVEPPRVTVGGPDCTQPYDMAMLSVSAMSFGSLSGSAIRALNSGAAKGGFAHDTGEGGLTDYHRGGGGDLIWEIGTGYFGTRTAYGDFDPDQFAGKASDPQIKCVSLKLSQGAKPGLGGVLPGPKVTEEIAQIRGVPDAPSKSGRRS